jgi:beta-glucosidase
LDLKRILFPYVNILRFHFPSTHVVIQFGGYVFFNASLKGISPLDGFKQFLENSSSSTLLKAVSYGQTMIWAVQAAQSSDVAIVMVH